MWPPRSALLKGLPTGYNKDLQEDKSLLFGAFDALGLVLPATRETVAGLVFNEVPSPTPWTTTAILATDVADELVRAAMPVPRSARRGRQAGPRGRNPRRVALDAARIRLAAAHPVLATGELPHLSPRASVEARAVPGGTARGAVLEQILAARAALRWRHAPCRLLSYGQRKRRGDREPYDEGRKTGNGCATNREIPRAPSGNPEAVSPPAA